MWAVIIVDSSNPTNVCKGLRGPICHVGRKTECDIAFPNDKSISRHHADILLEGDDLFLIDLGSKFSTIISDNKCEKNIKYRLIDGDIVNFGAIGCAVEISRLVLQLCTTKLDKGDKDKLKILSKSVNFEIVKSVEQCSHLICNRFSATVKTLDSIVTHKPIVTIDWLLSFGSDSSSFIVPPVDK